MELAISPSTIPSLVFSTLLLGVALTVGPILGRKVPTVDRLIIVWLVYDVLVHFILEGSFVYYSLTGTVESSEGFLAELWKEYAKADARWGVSDPTIVAMEIITVVLDGLLCLVLIHAIQVRAHYRHFVQIVLCVCELYGGWVTFCPEWVAGSPNLDTSNFLYMWIYLVFFNMIWVVIPLAILWHSWVELRDTNIKRPISKTTKSKGSKHK